MQRLKTGKKIKNKNNFPNKPFPEPSGSHEARRAYSGTDNSGRAYRAVCEAIDSFCGDVLTIEFVHAMRNETALPLRSHKPRRAFSLPITSHALHARTYTPRVGTAGPNYSVRNQTKYVAPGDNCIVIQPNTQAKPRSYPCS